MKYLLFILLSLPISSFSQSSDKKEILTLLRQQASAWNKGDLEGFMKG